MISIIIMLAAISSPIVIYLDSKKRMGKPSWGWVVGGFILFIMSFGQAGREFATTLPSSPGSVELAGFLGGVTGLWLGLFLFYRAFTRKATRSRAEKIHQKPNGKEANEADAEADRLLRKGIKAEAHGNYEEALTFYKEIVTAHPGTSQAEDAQSCIISLGKRKV